MADEPIDDKPPQFAKPLRQSGRRKQQTRETEKPKLETSCCLPSNAIGINL